MRSHVHPGVEVTLRVDGKDLVEHEDEEAKDDDGCFREGRISHTVVRYVEVVAGATFSIELRFEPGFEFRKDSIISTYILDGGRAPTAEVLQPIRGLQGPRSVSTLDYKEDGKWCGRTMAFAELQTSECAFVFNV